MKTLEDLRQDAGDDLAKKIIDSLRELSTLPPGAEDLYYALTGKCYGGPISDHEIIDWFYTPSPALDNQSPYERCKKGDHKIVENLINEYYSGLAY